MKAIIIDDERLARVELKRLLSQHKEINIVGEAVNVDDAITKITELNPELIFLDIQMPGKNGFELLEELDSVPSRKHIINLKWIESIEPWLNGGLLVKLKGGNKVEVSRRQAIKFKEMLSL
jgi:DNA-binding LytR/AlgR family response regulator